MSIMFNEKISWDVLRRHAGVGYALLLAPALVITIILFLLSLVPTFVYSFYRFVPPTSMEATFTVENYEAFAHPAYASYIWVTLRISATSTIVSMVLGYPLAHSIARTKSVRVKGLLLFSVVSMFFVSTIVRAYAWVTVLGRQGPIGSLLASFGFTDVQLLANEFAVTIGTIHWLLPFVIMTLIGPIQSIDPSLEDAARNLGANELEAFTSVTLPLSLPGIVAASLLSLTLGFGMFVTPMVLGGGLINMLASFIYNETIWGNNYPVGSAATVILLSLATIVSFGVSRFLEARIKVR